MDLNALLFIFIFLLGVIIGSFLNVVILRYNTGRSVNGRSGCFSCGKILSWRELFPIASFLWQGGKCFKCKSKISWQYPLVEFFTGLVFVCIFLRELNFPSNSYISNLQILSTIFYLIIFSILIVIFVYDLRHKIVPDALVYTFILLSLIKIVSQFLFAPDFFFWINFWAGPLFFLPFFLLWFISRGKWIGLGDGKLALGIGWLLGFDLGGSSLIFAFWIGAIFGILLIIFSKIFNFRWAKPVKRFPLSLHLKKLTMKSEIPFAPFIILSVFIVYCFRIDIFQVMKIFFNI